MGKRVTGQLAAVEAIGDNSELTIVDKATILAPTETVVQAVIPLGAADAYDITLPPVSMSVGIRVYVEFIRATGSYADGTVNVKGAGDEVGGAFDSGAVTTAGDFIVLDNVAGRRWALVASEVTGEA